ncbi:hypothetical protein [Prosthecobacter vanneervenii]|uniref:Mono/diheme cytochrome c family protein n=1 Tax=Prosthecobacter vanneervenii TaxID=48466 RepID=A0A7W8DM35_9BACT|nr:hypothetical protein [Prosthecobacter vanneervenii]MBB5034817.1 mono/diheme cytochrome c family protein [Prosthecobacter vanneervenii]
MKSLRLLLVLPVLLSSCAHTVRQAADASGADAALHVLEHNCVHCHGDNRLSTMPPINDTRAIAKLIGSHWIVPGRPDASRFYQVVIFPDEVPGAMPPSGHAISKKDAHALRQWIKDGARLPAQNVKLTPRGPLPRSI